MLVISNGRECPNEIQAVNPISKVRIPGVKSTTRYGAKTYDEDLGVEDQGATIGSLTYITNCYHRCHIPLLRRF